MHTSVRRPRRWNYRLNPDRPVGVVRRAASAECDVGASIRTTRASLPGPAGSSREPASASHGPSGIEEPIMRIRTLAIAAALAALPALAQQNANIPRTGPSPTSGSDVGPFKPG